MDPKCWDLAHYFLGDDATEKDINELAFGIQSFIEDFMDREVPDPMASIFAKSIGA